MPRIIFLPHAPVDFVFGVPVVRTEIQPVSHLRNGFEQDVIASDDIRHAHSQRGIQRSLPDDAWALFRDGDEFHPGFFRQLPQFQHHIAQVGFLGVQRHIAFAILLSVGVGIQRKAVHGIFDLRQQFLQPRETGIDTSAADARTAYDGIGIRLFDCRITEIDHGHIDRDC